jgi:hypothetical protein
MISSSPLVNAVVADHDRIVVEMAAYGVPVRRSERRPIDSQQLRRLLWRQHDRWIAHRRRGNHLGQRASPAMTVSAAAPAMTSPMRVRVLMMPSFQATTVLQTDACLAKPWPAHGVAAIRCLASARVSSTAAQCGLKKA